MGIGRSKTRQTREMSEPTLQVLLNDPMTRLVMKCDGVRQEQLTELLAVTRKRLAGAQSELRLSELSSGIFIRLPPDH